MHKELRAVFRKKCIEFNEKVMTVQIENKIKIIDNVDVFSLHPCFGPPVRYFNKKNRLSGKKI